MNNATFAVIMFFAGIGIPTMATLNGSLGVRLQNPVMAVSILLSLALALSLIILALANGLPKTPYATGTPWYFYMGGAFFIFYILSITAIAPSFGTGNAIAFVLLGQLVAMSAIDHFGLFGAQRFEISSQRLIGLAVMAMGVFLVVRRG